MSLSTPHIKKKQQATKQYCLLPILYIVSNAINSTRKINNNLNHKPIYSILENKNKQFINLFMVYKQYLLVYILHCNSSRSSSGNTRNPCVHYERLQQQDYPPSFRSDPILNRNPSSFDSLL